MKVAFNVLYIRKAPDYRPSLSSLTSAN